MARNFIKFAGAGLSLTLLPFPVAPKHCQSSDKVSGHKLLAGYRAIDNYVKSNMIVGLGTGSTVGYSLERLRNNLKNGSLFGVSIVPGSEELRKTCIAFSIPVATLSKSNKVDVFIDGVDEVDLDLNMVKGRSGSLLREKLIKAAADKTIIICDESKLTKTLGPGVPIPVEISPFSYEFTCHKLESLPSIYGCRAILRRGSINNNAADGPDIAVTDNGNFIVDLYFEKPLEDIEDAVRDLDSTAGVLEHGLSASSAIKPVFCPAGGDSGPSLVVMVASDKGVRIVGQDPNAEDPWWAEMPRKRALQREGVDNRQPEVTPPEGIHPSGSSRVVSVDPERKKSK